MKYFQDFGTKLKIAKKSILRFLILVLLGKYYRAKIWTTYTPYGLKWAQKWPLSLSKRHLNCVICHFCMYTQVVYHKKTRKLEYFEDFGKYGAKSSWFFKKWAARQLKIPKKVISHFSIYFCCVGAMKLKLGQNEAHHGGNQTSWAIFDFFGPKIHRLWWKRPFWLIFDSILSHIFQNPENIPTFKVFYVILHRYTWKNEK